MDNHQVNSEVIEKNIEIDAKFRHFKEHENAFQCGVTGNVTKLAKDCPYFLGIY